MEWICKMDCRPFLMSETLISAPRDRLVSNSGKFVKLEEIR